MKDKYTLVGFMATREPDGTFNPAIPLYRDESIEEDETDKMSWDDLMSYFDRLVLEKMKGVV